MNRTGIEWTTFSANPLKYRDAAGKVVWGCVHKSDGCRHCYSEVLAKRYGRGGPFSAQVMKGLTPFLDEAELRHMVTAKRIGGVDVSGGRCFVGDMTDLFGEWVPDDILNRLFSNVLEHRQDVTWQLLTKRADRLRAYLSWRYGEGRIPARNIHVGVSVEDQATANERIPLLLLAPAAVRFISLEPQLADVHLDRGGWLRPNYTSCQQPDTAAIAEIAKAAARTIGWAGLDWVIQGGESGPGARPFDLAWARSVRDQCRAAGVAYFLKQLGAEPYDSAAVHIPVDVMFINDPKGGTESEWPEDLRGCRAFPKVGGR